MPSMSGQRFPSFVGGSPAPPNKFGVGVGLTGLVAGWLIATAAINLWPHHGGMGQFTQDLLNLGGLWIGLIGAVLFARRIWQTGVSMSASGTESGDTSCAYLVQLRKDYGIVIRPVDVPLGIVVGLVSQYLLTPIFELPLVPFVTHLYTRLNAPADSLTKGVSGGWFAILGIFVCLGSPLVEELYFRGLILRGLLGKCERLSPKAAIALPVIISGLFFGLVHFEPLEFLGLAGFGMILALLAYSTGRLGPGIVAHITFNTATFIALSTTH